MSTGFLAYHGANRCLGCTGRMESLLRAGGEAQDFTPGPCAQGGGLDETSWHIIKGKQVVLSHTQLLKILAPRRTLEKKDAPSRTTSGKNEISVSAVNPKTSAAKTSAA